MTAGVGTGEGEQQIAAVDEEECDSVASGEFFETVNVFLFSTICAVVAGLKNNRNWVESVDMMTFAWLVKPLPLLDDHP